MLRAALHDPHQVARRNAHDAYQFRERAYPLETVLASVDDLQDRTLHNMTLARSFHQRYATH